MCFQSIQVGGLTNESCCGLSDHSGGRSVTKESCCGLSGHSGGRSVTNELCCVLSLVRPFRQEVCD